MAISIDVIAELERRSVERTAAELDKSFKQYNVPIGADVKAAEIKAAAEKIQREFSDIRAEVKIDVDKTAASRLGDIKRGIDDVENSAKSATNVLTQLGKAGFGATRGLITLAAPIAIEGLIQLTEVGTAATQALWLLPAALSAAGAGMGTLALATNGFGDALKHMGDPKKWAEDLQSLSPAAQQAALEIKNLVDGPLGALQNATQDAFFKGLPEQIDRLVTQYLPSIQNLTTGIATSFNQMMTGVGNQLLTPETQASMQTLFANITQTFQNLAPAAAPVVQAFTDIATVGSQFLPGLAQSITNAANSFAVFISNARESGKLHEWIQQGIDAVANLGTALGELVSIFYRVFGPDSNSAIDSQKGSISSLQQTVQSYNADLTKMSDIIGLLTGDTETWGNKWNEEMMAMQGPLGSFRDMILDIPEAMGVVINAAIDMANGVNHAINYMANNATNALDHLLPGDQHYDPIADIPYVGRHGETGGAEVKDSWGDWGGYQSTQGPFGNNGQPTLGGDPNAQRQRRGAPSLTDNNAPGIGAFPVPPPPPEGGKGSDKDRRDAIIAGLDPKTWQVDPFAGMPPTGPGHMVGPSASPQEILQQQRDVISQAHDVEEATKARLALEKDNTATAQDIDEAKWKEVEAGWKLQEAQQKLADKMNGTASSTKSGMDNLTAALDPDLGLGKGLSGLADNLVRFLGAAALAGPMAQMQATMDASPIKGGYGLLGINGANNIAAGNSPLLGQPYGANSGLAGLLGGAPGAASAGGMYPSSYTAPAAGTYGSSSAASAALPSGAYPGDAALLAGVPRGIGHYDNTTKDLSQGLVDCASGVEDLVNMLDGKSTAGGSLATGTASSVLPGMGFQQGVGGPGDFRIGYNSHHMQATLPQGTNVNYGSTSAIQQGGVSGSQGAYDPSFDQHWFRPVGGGGGIAAPPGASPAVADILSRMPAQAPATAWTPGMPNFTGGGGQSPVLPNQTTPGVGGGIGMNGLSGLAADTANPTPLGGLAPPAPNAGGGGVGITPGGTIDTAINLAASAFPGVGQAAATGMKLASRAVQYGGQIAGDAVGGLMETFLPTGGSELANNSWLTRIVGGLAGASPALPNIAGGKGGGGQPPGALQPNQVAKPFANAQPGNQINVQYNNNGATEDRAGADLTHHLGNQLASPMGGMGKPR